MVSFEKLKRNYNQTWQGFFIFQIKSIHQIFDGGTRNFSSPAGPQRGRSRMGGRDLRKNPTEAETANLMQN